MPPSDISIRLKVLNRFQTVLAAITAGGTYWFTPQLVAKRLLPFEEFTGNPGYMVFPDGQDRDIEITGHITYDEFFVVRVAGVCYDKADPVAKAEKCIQDIRLAIDTDSKNPAAGTLGTLAVQVRTKKSPDFDWYDDFAFFEQEYFVQTTGDMGVI